MQELHNAAGLNVAATSICDTTGWCDPRVLGQSRGGTTAALSRCMLQAAAEDDVLTEAIIGCAIRVHEHFGPGLFESAYQRAVTIELQEAGLPFETGRRVPLVYRDIELGCVYQPDLIVANTVMVELKAVDVLAPVHRAQLLTYLKLTQCPVGLIINFNVALLKDGIRRRVRPDLYRGRRKGCEPSRGT
jgi:GxxExxY protein